MTAEDLDQSWKNLVDAWYELELAKLRVQCQKRLPTMNPNARYNGRNWYLRYIKKELEPVVYLDLDEVIEKAGI